MSGGSFPRRHEDYVALVANGSERALEQMIVAYRRVDLDATERGRIVSLACDGFPSPECTALLRAWRETSAGPDDAWLWFRALRREIETLGPEAATAAAGDATRPAPIRAAAIRALAAWSDPGLVNLVADLAKSDLGKDPDRALLVQTLAEALVSQAGRIGTPALREAFAALLPFLAKGGAEPRTRLLVARSLSRMLAAPRTPLDPAAYEALLDRRERPPSPEDDRYAAPRFAGLEATGDRVVYVVDESGSMDTWLAPGQIDELRRAVGDPQGKDDPVAAIPWDKLRTRRDAALALTQASIRALPESAVVGVVLFGTGIAWIPSPFTLVPATKPNVDALVRALGGPRVGGGTNLHGGLRRALDAVLGGRKGKTALGATVNGATTTLGPTTVFLLTDGEPSCDDWGFDYKGIGLSPLDPAWHPTAPFQEPVSLAEDVARLNLFRACEIHAVGIGEADGRLLDRLASVGRGRVRRVALTTRPGVPVEPAGPTAGGAPSAPVPSHQARDLVAALERLGLAVPRSLRERAEAEEKAEKEARTKEKKEGTKGGGMEGSEPAAGEGNPAPREPPPRAPPGSPGSVPAPAEKTHADLEALRHGASASERRNAAWRLGDRKDAPAVPDLARALVDDPDPSVSRACEVALEQIVGRGFLEWRPDLAPWERESLRRNWAWWWDLHREAITKAAAEKAAAPAPGQPVPGK